MRKRSIIAVAVPLVVAAVAGGRMLAEPPAVRHAAVALSASTAEFDRGNDRVPHAADRSRSLVLMANDVRLHHAQELQRQNQQRALTAQAAAAAEQARAAAHAAAVAQAAREQAAARQQAARAVHAAAPRKAAPPQPAPAPRPATAPRPAPAPAANHGSASATWAASARATHVRNCESGNNYRANTGNGYYGAYQFSEGTWRSVGGQGYPQSNSVAEQDYRAYVLWQRSGWSSWGCA